MRLLSLTLLSVLPVALAAQQFKIGISAHALHHSGQSRDDWTFGAQKGFGYGGALALTQSHDWIELKYVFETGSLKGKQVEVSSTLNAVPAGTPPQTVVNGAGYQSIADQYYLPYVAANVKIPLFKLKPYAGIMVALAKTNGSGKMNVYQYTWNAPVYFEPFHTYGVGAGVQAGGALPLSRHFELTGELAYRRIWLDEFLINVFGPANSIVYQLNTWQFNAGINYVFNSAND